MHFLRQNLHALQATRPELAGRIQSCVPGPEVEAFAVPGGSVSLRVNGRLEASSEDPEAEARELAAHFLERARAAGAARMVVFGLGVHTLRFLDAFRGDILVIEPSLEVCRRVLERVDLGEMLSRIELVVDPRPGPALAHPIFRADQRGIFVAHVAARRRAPGLLAALTTRFHPGGACSTLDVAVIPPLYGGSLPVARACARRSFTRC